jgi:hypothetical protein
MEYVARYSLQNRWTAIALAAFFGVLSVILAIRSTYITGLMISAGFFLFFVWYATHVAVTQIRFTKERIVARLPWSKKLCEPYRSVLKLTAKPVTVEIRFSDGRSLKLNSGLGDPDVILAYLHEHCPHAAVGKEG